MFQPHLHQSGLKSKPTAKGNDLAFEIQQLDFFVRLGQRWWQDSQTSKIINNIIRIIKGEI